ncbi:eukaryotic translation initiation factor 4 gamma 3-like [Limulus polyphemus]|uniref:Eukaryotic translation initiation factor 4 gamma 3-like n=1 Tax=Limulus polyphemus TaxID=6850 RepID=A0ABM1BDP7_LIMPO|nr:eukaryotic translation initiation factor 4 gamma 3-like [Limulus polyphemus]
MSLQKGKYQLVAPNIQHQQRGTHNLQPCGQTPPQLGREDFVRPLVPYPPQHQAFRQHIPGHTSVSSGNPHDMSKPGPLPTQGVPSAALSYHPQLPQPGMPTSAVNGTGVLPQHQGQQIPRPQAGFTAFYHPSSRQSASIPVHTMPRQNMTTMNTNPPALNHTQMGVIYSGNPNFGSPMAHQQLLMQSPVPAVSYHHRPQQYAAPQYSMPNAHQHVFLTAGNPQYAYNPQMHQQCQYYYSVVPSMMGPPQLTMQPAPPNVVGCTTTREKKIIRLQDPNTGQDLTETILNSKRTQNTPSDSPEKSIIAQFATQVAAAATSVTPRKEPTPSPNSFQVESVTNMVNIGAPKDMLMVDSQPMNLVTNHVSDSDISLSTPLEVNKSVFVSSTISKDSSNHRPSTEASVSSLAEIPNEKAERADPAKSESIVNKHDICLEKIVTSESDDDINKGVASRKADIPIDPANGPQKEMHSESCAFISVNGEELFESTISETVVHLKTNVETQTPFKDDSNVKEGSLVERKLFSEGKQKFTESAKIIPGDKVHIEVKPEEEKKRDVDSIKSKLQQSQENGDISYLPNTNLYGGEKGPDAKESKKARGKKKVRELNRKGDNKEGGEMDAYVDKQVDAKPVITTVQESVASVKSQVSSSLPVPAGSTKIINDVKVEPSCNDLNSEPLIKTSIVEPAVSTFSQVSSTSSVSSLASSISTTDNKLELSEVERKVAEKNEENIRVSQERENEVEGKDISELELPKEEIKLKYTYQEDQWSPLNLGGKKQYDRTFLLLLQSQQCKKPQGLPDLDIIKDKMLQNKLPDINLRPPPLQARNHPDPFVPLFARTGSPRPPPGGMGRRASQPSSEKPKKIISISTSLNKDVRLHEAQNAWRPSHKGSKEADPEDVKTQELYKRLKGILNKLTPQMFQPLVRKIFELQIDTEDRLIGVIDLVFQKAIDEPSFSVTYANLCKNLASIQVSSGTGHQVKFSKLLLIKCQQEFEKDVDDYVNKNEYMKKMKEAETEEEKKQLQEDLEEEEKKAKRRSLGNIRFIGELFKQNMLTPKIMDGCIQRLLRQGDEDSLECLCRLLTTVGKDLEGEKGKNKIWTQQMDNYCLTMRDIIKKKLTCPRIRFMLQDVLELRQKNWIPRRDQNNPKTIDQIHKEAQKEAQEQQMLLQQVIPHKRPEDRERRKSRGNTPYSEDGWNTVSNKHRIQIDPNKIKQLAKNQQNTENIQLGPGGRSFTSWGRGSSGGTKQTSKDNEPKVPVPSNRFSALAGDQTTCTDSRRTSQRSAASSRESSRGRTSQLPPPGLRKTPSQTLPREKEQLIEITINKEKPRTEPKKLKEQAPTSLGLTLNGGPLNDEEVERRTKHLIDEFLHLQDFKEAMHCVSEVFSSSTVSLFIFFAFNQVLERSSQARHLVGQLFHDLVRKNMITVEQYVQGLKSILQLADDFEIDIPKIWLYLGEIIAPMVQDGSISLVFLQDAAEPCIASGTAGILLSEVLHVAVEKLGSLKVGELWRTSGMQWKDFLKPGQDVDTFIQTHKLQFTVKDNEVLPDTSLSIDDIKRELDFLLQKKKANNEEILDWIEAHIGERKSKDTHFIRVLVTAVIESCIEGDQNRCELNAKTVALRTTVLQRYLDHKEELELQALYALQALVHRLEHPKGLLRLIFDALYDEDLISDDAFTQWQKSDDPAEKEGKGVALKSVMSFFTWLEEAEQESEDSDPES